jgi:hypothetical protein
LSETKRGGKPVLCLALTALIVGPRPPGDRPITAAEEVVAIYVDQGLRPSGGGPKLVLAAWGDGQVVWSQNAVEGGAPYFAGQVPPARVAEALERVTRDGAFADETLGHVRYGPDAGYTTILLKHGGHRLEMSSWHELYEEAGKLVAGASGLRPLEGRDRLAALRAEPAEYLYYRMAWAELRTLAASLRPAGGRRVRGELVMANRMLSWREAAPGE